MKQTDNSRRTVRAVKSYEPEQLDLIELFCDPAKSAAVSRQLNQFGSFELAVSQQLDLHRSFGRNATFFPLINGHCRAQFQRVGDILNGAEMIDN
jgi:hypothetical protein